MNALCNSKIIGRSILTVDHKMSVEKLYDKDCAFQQNDYSDSYYLWCTHATTVHGEENNSDHAGMLLLESIKKHGSTPLKLLPVGILFFTCSIEVRNKFLADCQFDYFDVLSGNVKIKIFNACQILAIEKYLSERHNGENNNDWIELRDFIVSTADQYKEHAPNVENFTNACTIERWNAVSILQKWLENCNVTPSFGAHYYRDESVRSLNRHERNWLFVQVCLRYPHYASMPQHLTNKAVCQMRIATQHFPQNASQTRTNESKSITNALEEIKQASAIGRDFHLTGTLLSRFKSQQTSLRDGMKTAHRLVIDKLDDVRQRYRAFPLYITLRINAATDKMIENFPSNAFDSDGVRKWCRQTNESLDAEFNLRNVYGNAYANAKACVLPPAGKQFLRLYGNTEELLKRTTSDEPVAYNYKVENLGKLSNADVKPLPCYGTPSAPNVSAFDYQRHDLSQVARRLSESVDFCTPIWSERTETSSMNYLRLVPNYDPSASNAGTVEQLLAEHVYNPKLSKQTNAEYINSGLHYNCFVGDLDLSLSPETTPPDKRQFARDVVEATDVLFEKLFSFKARAHYIYASKNDDSSGKLGFHQFSFMPISHVLCSQFCIDFATILNVIRHAWPDTLGIQLSNDDLYDTNIYPRSHGESPKGHCLRGPGQTNEFGQRKLECILATDEITLNSKLVHGAQIKDDGSVAIFGTVYSHVQDAVNFKDEAFMTTQESFICNYISETCFTTPEQIMKEINQRVVLFTNFQSNVLLLKTINDLWQTNGIKALLAHMSTARGRNDVAYSERDVNRVRMNPQSFVFVHRPETNSIQLVVKQRHGGYANVSFCLIKPHNRPLSKSGLHVRAMYNKKMIRIVLKTKCFKTSCHGKSIVPNVFLTMESIFVARFLKEEILSFYARFLQPDAQLKEIACDDHNQFENVIFIEPIHNNAGLNAYNNDDSGNVDLQIRYVYMYVTVAQGTYLVVGVGSKMFAACVQYRQNGKKMAYTCDDYKRLCRGLEKINYLPTKLLVDLQAVFKLQHD